MEVERIKLETNSDLQKASDLSYMDTIMANFYKEVGSKKDEIIKQRLTEAGLDVNDIEYLKEHISRIIKEGDNYEHYYFDFGKKTEKRIISIERPRAFPMPDFQNNETGHRVTYTTKFY